MRGLFVSTGKTEEEPALDRTFCNCLLGLVPWEIGGVKKCDSSDDGEIGENIPDASDPGVEWRSPKLVDTLTGEIISTSVLMGHPLPITFDLRIPWPSWLLWKEEEAPIAST